MIELIEIEKRYKTNHGRSYRTILDKINLRVERGEKWGILGRNGAGKSSLIRLLSGSERPNSGKIRKTMSVSWPLAFGDAFQGALTGRDNAKLISRVYGVDFLRTLAVVEDFAELGSYLNEPVKNYSSGMRSRLAFAISMAIEFDCFLIDEAMSVGDYRFTQKCNKELFEKRRDRAMVIVAHQKEVLTEHCDHGAVLHDGKLFVMPSIHDAISYYESL